MIPNEKETLQSLLAAIVESSDDAIISKSLDSVITSWNKSAEKMFGYTAEEAIGKSILMLIPPDRQNEEGEILSRLRRGDRIDHYETLRRRKDGKEIRISLTISPIRDASGTIVGASKIARDLTARELERAQLKEERETLMTINRIGQLLSAELDLNKLVQALTDAATEIAGAEFGAFFYNLIEKRGNSYQLYTYSRIAPEQVANFPMPRVTELFEPTFRGEGVVRLADVRQDPRHGKAQPYFGFPAGHVSVVSYLAVPVISRTGAVIGGLFFGHSQPDVFKERHEWIIAGLAAQAAIAMDNASLYEAAQRARHDAEAANRLKDDFLANVSHELRTPLTAIFGWTRMLRAGRLDATGVGHALETIERNARAQEQIIEDILDVSRIITGKIRLEASPIEIAPVIEAAADTLRPTAEARSVRLQTILDTGPHLVFGDAGRLQQIFWNLLSNAIKFTPRDGRVQVTLSRVNSHLEIKVNDTGQGIKPEFLAYVFERFRQADSSTTRGFGGLGLGLSIVRHLTELHGGTVTAESPGEGMGATFTVKLPLAVMRDGFLPPDPDSHPRFNTLPSRKVSVEFTEDVSGVRVLVVDDESDARDLLSAILQQSGAEVRVADSTAQGIMILKQWRPDILVSDIGMPQQDGYVLIREVRALPADQGGATPAIALTAFARSEDRMKALRAGFQTHLAKPVEPIELVVTIAGLMRSFGRLRS